VRRARFYLTANTSCKEVVEIIRFVKAGGTFVPLSSLALQRADRSASISMALKTHQFTLRELAVLDRLILGKTNKAIAHELQTSESTVKVHIRNMMKKMSAKNRTEVVCLAYELIARAGALSEPAITEENRRDKAVLPVREQSLSVGDREKTALMAEGRAEGGQVSVVAQRHGISKNLLYNYRSARKAAARVARALAVSPMEFVQLDLVAEASEQSSAMRMATGAVSPARHPSNGLANSRRPRPSPMEWGNLGATATGWSKRG